ncbi:MAG: hypothetical protein COU07_04125 [Candidatus Harrisonbacteria bacterium CG10_big_fil_rev_8_21_14_0_10_40_38]|uniref:Ligand-binding protein SH3 n=1 Tax=Candidatus Harrisonbacteria bacterium CG10_big_fil_rev_8_21_14_0_10_40_38 TaxID=1974583 RepID=A0A2H0UR49_9BACT|nr:MAG: hypothetical protein COU07_04125 [Candidatus Harrisonbacteria bacterium CG10_big_fil_rev_8_21_14_0_10_40_38]
MFKELITILIAMTPTLEAHGAILAGIAFHFSIIKSFFLAIIGMVLITGPLLLWWRVLSEYFMHRVYLINRFMSWLFSYTRRKHSDKFENIDPAERKAHLLKAIVLYIFVAVPGPFTGVWGGTVAAYVFGVPFKYAYVSLVLGAVTVAVLDSLVIAGAIKILGFG